MLFNVTVMNMWVCVVCLCCVHACICGYFVLLFDNYSKTSFIHPHPDDPDMDFRQKLKKSCKYDLMVTLCRSKNVVFYRVIYYHVELTLWSLYIWVSISASTALWLGERKGSASTSSV